MARSAADRKRTGVAAPMIGGLAVALFLAAVLLMGRTESIITGAALLMFAACLDCSADAVAIHAPMNAQEG